jgi:cobalt-zinc-cadmium efflux system membrane fusion protein
MLPKWIPAARRGIRPRFTTAAFGALLVLGTVAAAWLWAHEGHRPLPTRGAEFTPDQGLVTLSPEAREALGVRTVEVRRYALEEQVTAPAWVVSPWQRRAYVTARVGGKIAALHVQPGQAVAPGQPLAEVESLELENLELELLDAQNAATLAAKNYEQLQSAGQKGAVTANALAEVRFQHQQSLAALDLARQKLQSLGATEDPAARAPQDGNARSLPRLPVKSPLRGAVTHVNVALGQTVEAAEPLVEVADLSRVWVKIGVLERDLPKIEAGQRVEVRFTAFPDARDVLASVVHGRGFTVDPQTHLGTAWAEFANANDRIRPGMFGEAHVQLTAPKEGLLLPDTALVRSGAERYVFVEEGPGQYRRQNVVVERQRKDGVQVAADGGLVPGDRVVTAGSRELATFFVPTVLRLSKEAGRNIGLRVEPAQEHPVADVVSLGGVVDLPPEQRAVVSPRLAGTLYRIHVEHDQVVRAGDVLAEVASLELQDLQLELLRSHLEMTLQEQALERLRPLTDVRGPFGGRDGTADRQWRETEGAHTAARQRRDSLLRKLEALGLSPQQLQDLLQRKKTVAALPVRAPLGGSVVRCGAVLGQAVRAEEPLFEIHDLSRVWVQGFVPERELAKVRVGQPVRVYFVGAPESVAEATVVRHGVVPGGENRTVSVWAAFRQPPALTLAHNMLASLAVTVGTSEPTLAVPLAAVWRDGTQAYVFVRKADDTFERRPVVVGRSDDRYAEITSGLRVGEDVVVRGTEHLQTAYASLQ